MKIDNLPGTGTPKATDTRTTQATPAPAGRSEGPGTSATRDDSVTLTDTARRLVELKNQLGNMPSVDSHRVEQVRQALEDGSYQIDPSRVGEKVFQFEVK